jgi:hypothetical protein
MLASIWSKMHLKNYWMHYKVIDLLILVMYDVQYDASCIYI